MRIPKITVGWLVVAMMVAVPVLSFAAQFKEAPMLAELVKAGKLPPVEERLPKNPRVLPVYESVGQYGGTWHRAYNGINDRWNPAKIMEERIVEFYMPNPETVEMMANWCSEYTISPDAKEFTFHIREGMKWSDGHPLTTDDVKFWYEDVFLNKDLVSAPPSGLSSGGEPLKIEILDQYTFTVKFANPYPLFLSYLAKESTGAPGLFRDSFVVPAHYLKNYLPKYAAQADLDKIVAQYQVKNWKDLWTEKGQIQSSWLNPDLPVISAWKVKVPPPAEQVVFERNPYYWAVDKEGQQLPYIDTITFDLFQNAETMNLWIVQGKIDAQMRHVNSDNLALYKQNEKQGNYHVVTWRGTGIQSFFPNLNVEDPILNELFNNSKFRQALSIAINRQELIDLSPTGFGKPYQAAPVAGTPYYDPEFAQKWTEYDPATANKLLDELGLNKKDNEGYRLRSDGKRLSITLVYIAPRPIVEPVQKYWKDIGVELLLKAVERGLFDELRDGGKTDMISWSVDRNCVIEADPQNYLGYDKLWAIQWGRWFNTGGKEGVEPPKDHPFRKLWDAWKKAQSVSDPNEARKYIQEIVTVHKENVWIIGTVGETPAVLIVSNKMHNVPDNLISDESFREEGLGQPAQYWLEK